MITFSFLFLLCVIAQSCGVEMDPLGGETSMSLSVKEEGEGFQSFPGMPRNQNNSDGLFPWMVALFRNDSFICSATLISKRLVMTAAHCVIEDRNPASYKGHAGSRDRNSPQQRIAFRQMHVHPQYRHRSNNATHDVAILLTTREVPSTPTIRSVCLSRETKMPANRRMIVDAGWPEGHHVLRYGQLEENAPLCESSPRRPNLSEMCLTQKRGSAVRPGDSGGPVLVLTRERRFVQAGILSRLEREIGTSREYVKAARVGYSYNFITKIGRNANTPVCFV